MHVPTESDAERNGSSVLPEGPGAESQGVSTLHALLIGVDHYDPHTAPDGLRIPDLAGAARDALLMERYLREGPLAVPAERIRTLIAPGLFSGIAPPAAEDLPTYANIVREISALAERAGPGDQVLIQFSGHGVRVPSAEKIQQLKGRFGLDEALVPCDAASPAGGVLRDVEMYGLLSRLAESGAYVTLLFDACHSGGATRDASFLVDPEASGALDGGQVRTRGLGERRGLWGPVESAVARWDDLYAAVERAEREEQEAADGHRPGYRHFAGESGWFPQPPRCVLLAACRGLEVAREQPCGADGVSGAFTHSVLESLRTLGDGVSYATLYRTVQQRIHALWAAQTPILEGDGSLRFLGAGRRPETPHGRPSATKAPGAGAGGRAPGAPVVRCRVGLDADAPPDLLQALRRNPSPVVELVPDGSGSADLLLGLAGGDSVEVRDTFGAPLDGSGAPVPLDHPEAERTLSRRLAHLALYTHFRDLAPPVDSPFQSALRLGLFRLERKEDWHDTRTRVPVRGNHVRTGELLCLVIRNLSEQPLNAIVLDLRSDWAVERVHPPVDEGELAVLEPGREHPVFLGTWLPDELDQARSVLKVIASVEPISSAGFEMPALEAAAGEDASPGSTGELDGPAALLDGHHWTTAALELTVVR